MDSGIYFSKINFQEYLASWYSCFPIWLNEEDISYRDKIVWNSWKKVCLPEKTADDTYVIRCPIDISVRKGETLIIPSGLSCSFKLDNVLINNERYELKIVLKETALYCITAKSDIQISESDVLCILKPNLSITS